MLNLYKMIILKLVLLWSKICKGKHR